MQDWGSEGYPENSSMVLVVGSSLVCAEIAEKKSSRGTSRENFTAIFCFLSTPASQHSSHSSSLCNNTEQKT